MALWIKELSLTSRKLSDKFQNKGVPPPPVCAMKAYGGAGA